MDVVTEGLSRAFMELAAVSQAFLSNLVGCSLVCWTSGEWGTQPATINYPKAAPDPVIPKHHHGL